MANDRPDARILIVGGGIGGLAAALALVRQGLRVIVLEQSHAIGEIGAGIQLGPNAFGAFDALGVGDRARSRAVYTERMLMMDAVDGSTVADVPLGDAFRARFGNPYAVIHRADVHTSLLEGVQAAEGVELVTSTRVDRVEITGDRVAVIDPNGGRIEGDALIGCDGVKSSVRQQFVGDAVRVSGHVVYRAVVDAAEFPADLKINAPVLWAGPNCHLVHYPLRGGEQYNVVVTFHSRQPETWGVTDGSSDEVQSYFDGILPRPRQLLAMPKSWKRWATADRDPIERWSFGRVTLLGDAAHPMLQYLAQGACMALEDAVCLADSMWAHSDDPAKAFLDYQRERIPRTSKAQRWARGMGELVHLDGMGALLRDMVIRDRADDDYAYVDWLYGYGAEG